MARRTWSFLARAAAGPVDVDQGGAADQVEELEGAATPDSTAVCGGASPGWYTPSMAIRPELREELLRLSAEEREALAEELYESVGGDVVDPAWQQAWAEEVRRRAQDVTDRTVELVDADDVHAEIRSGLGHRGK